MWNLVRLSLAYHRQTLLVAWGVALGVGLVHALVSWIRSGFGAFDRAEWFLLPMLVFLATGIASVVAFETEDRERRLLLHLPLPVTRTQVGAARVVFPALMIVLGTAATALLSLAILVSGGAWPSAKPAWQLLFSATMLMFFLQLLLTVLTMVRGGRHRPRRLLGIVTLVLLLAITMVVWILLAVSGSYLLVALGTVGLTLGLMGLSVVLFERRASFVSG